MENKNAIKNNVHITILILLFILTIASHISFDKFTINKSALLNFIFFPMQQKLSYLMMAIFLFLGLVGAYIKDKNKTSKNLILLIASLLLSLAIGYLLKTFISRPRPNLLDNKSFPSNHSNFMFALLPFFSLFGTVFYCIWLILSLYVAFSRVYLHYHFFSDIFAGAFIGYAVGIFIKYLRFKNKIMKR